MISEPPGLGQGTAQRCGQVSKNAEASLGAGPALQTPGGQDVTKRMGSGRDWGGGTRTMGDTKAGAEDLEARFPPPQCLEVGVLNQEQVSGAQARSE